ncbi:hypothetical protein SAMN05428945_0872 [Streptomyces sp. 2224.1]|nr:hypothetical protein BX261_4507 [Streptomyces sp. 2321.6]SDR29648.1 hypothetical protein SAMN05216511_2693 [Streptomyces sp. KS_16]SEB68840.1 hypothetical protein SAMN05428945_0872 [Streptomyces sp. 2224.1]SED34270.1 hypothetical protein SAMN05428940_4534 [Streptomyces sp. 2133.1]SEE49522.1 hypothetical protein SAMN05428954_2794 [Streptomyces sp. 2112.3]SNC70601.1 hypothetical protein SAMN06272741_4498 [Streptomyces sp. 2114.4]
MGERPRVSGSPPRRNHSLNDHRRIEWRNFPIEELCEIFPLAVKRIEVGGSFFNRHLIRDPIRSRCIPVVVVNHLIHDLVAKDHDFRHKVIGFDI